MSGFFDAKRGGGGGFTKTESVVIIVDKIVVDNKKQGNWEKDHFEGRLFYSALGIKADYAESEPVTKVKVFQNKPTDKEATGDFRRQNVWDKQFKMGLNEIVQPGGLVLVENATYDKAKGEVRGGWLKVMSAPSYNPDILFPVRQWAYMGAERKAEDGSVSQRATVIDGEYSQTFDGLQDFRAKAIEMISAAIESPSLPGTPGVLVRAVERESGQALVSDIRRSWDGENKKWKSAEESVDAWIKNQEDLAQDSDPERAAASWVNAMANNPEFFFEVVPSASLNTGKQSLPSVKWESKKQKGKVADYDDAVSSHAYPKNYTDRDGNDKTGMRFGWIKVDMLAQRRKSAEVPGFDSDDEFTPWTRTYTRPTGEVRETREWSQFPTATLPPEIEAKFSENGKKNAAEMVKARKEAREANNAPAREAAEDQQQMAPAGP